MVGYIKSNMKTAGEARVGDTYHLIDHPVDPEPGF